MTPQMEAVLFDMGGTLRRMIRRDWEEGKVEIHRMIALMGMETPVEDFARKLSLRAQNYQRWARETCRELNETDLWTQWMLPDIAEEDVRRNALQLNQLWRDAWSTKVNLPEAREVILSLFRRGYRLGLVSNTTSSLDAPQTLQKLGIGGCFETIQLSCEAGSRKPDPAMLIAAAAQMEIHPRYCAYIGDCPDRDVAAARSAGFGQVMLLRDPANPQYQQHYDPSLEPDRFVDNLQAVLDLFPERQPHQSQMVNASLSTMWARRNFPTLEDFLIASRRMGFAQVELNHEINSEMLAGIAFENYSIPSVHEPCPADISTGELKGNDWLISSADEEKRVRGVESIKRSIELAGRLGAQVVVVHAGQVTGDLSMEKQLRSMIETGKTQSQEVVEVRARMIQYRADVIEAHFGSVKKSLGELLEHAANHHVRLGLENRFHYTDIPTPDEMGELLDMGDPNHLGMIFDTGHAQVLDHLGFFGFEEWLQRFSSRIIAVHLHDVKSVTDHGVPGTGEVNFNLLASYLDEKVLMTFEIHASHSFEQIRTGLKWMVLNGWVKPTRNKSYGR